MIQRKIKNNKTCSTLLEALVVIGILVILSTTMFLSTRAVGGKQKLDMSTQELASNLRLMQSYVLNLRDAKGNIPEGGWGIYFDLSSQTDRYQIVFDNGTTQGNEYYFDTNEKIREVVLPKGVYVSEVRVDGVSSTNPCINYSPPDPSVHLCEDASMCSGGGSATTLEIDISNFDDSDSKTIVLNKYGLIDVQN